MYLILKILPGRSLLITLTLLLWFTIENSFSQAVEEPAVGFIAGQPLIKNDRKTSPLLFYLSGNNGFTADYAAGGQILPNYKKDVSVIPDGAFGAGLRAEDSQLLTYWAPGNIYAQRGTLSFFWRSRYPVGPTPFPVFRVGYADHSSWDMVWLRIDYNGSGFDAFVTDIGLARTRVSYFPDKFPDPGEWIHLALSWDETDGIRFYVNGKITAKQSAANAVFDTGLDQFGPHSRIISPYQVQSAYSFMRGGDIDELRIYDQAVSDEAVSLLAKGKSPDPLPTLIRDLADRHWRDEWWLQNGWNLPNQPPPELPSEHTAVRKVEIHDAFDIKRWYWKANDGIRETTWPGVYNMSRLPGRYDYFVLPDWDCYSGSGQSVKFTLPVEKWNHIEIWGKAWGQMTLEDTADRDYTFGVRTQNQIKSVHRLKDPHTGGKIRFDNAMIEEPIGSFDVYFVRKGEAPGRSGSGSESESEKFLLYSAPDVFDGQALGDLASFIKGRYPADERTMMLAVRDGDQKILNKAIVPEHSLPFIHILLPYSPKQGSGLDGVEIKLPRLNVRPTHNGFFPINIRIKDPLWPMRDLADFSFSVRPGDSPTLWIDTRDRILPAEHALYITVAGAGADLTSDLLVGTQIRLIYKTKESARPEHEVDRFTQIRDLYAQIVEERPRSSRLNLYNRFMADCNDLLSLNPGHWLAQTYRYAATGNTRPAYTIPKIPEGMPEWAFLQTEYLRQLAGLVNYYIDNRQIPNGEFGGGLSDDGDLTNMWPGIAFLGIEPDKVLKSLKLHMTAYYDQERSPVLAGFRQRSLPLFTNGLATIFTDELHALEDGIQVVAQLQLLDYGNPLFMERGMETARRMLNDITQINSAGHRHFRSRYYGGTRIATEDPWQWSVNRSYHVLQTSYLVARYNGNPALRKMIVELADGILAHQKNGYLYTDINFSTDEVREDTGIASGEKPWSLFYAAWKITGNKKYLEPFPDRNLNKGVFDKKMIADRYRAEITSLGVRQYINTEGSIWIDRLSPFNPAIQEDRLGGVALTRTSVLYPAHFVSWQFRSPAKYDDVAIFLPSPSESEIKIIAYNLAVNSVNASVNIWDVKPGKWIVHQGLDTDDDQLIDSFETSNIVNLERGKELPLVFAPRKYNIVILKLIEPSKGELQELPDLAIGPEDIKIGGKEVTIRVHNIGGAMSPLTILELRDGRGKLIATAQVPSLEAPVDLLPRWKEISFHIEPGTDLAHGSLQLDPDGKITEITRINSQLKW
jgi:hypothetical protein